MSDITPTPSRTTTPPTDPPTDTHPATENAFLRPSHPLVTDLEQEVLDEYARLLGNVNKVCYLLYGTPHLPLFRKFNSMTNRWLTFFCFFPSTAIDQAIGPRGLSYLGYARWTPAIREKNGDRVHAAQG